MSISKAAELIRKARYTITLSGAGISTRSGIPDFRSEDGGLWHKFNPMEVASLMAFRTQPEKFFDWFRPMAKNIFDAKPNPAHLALAQLERAGYIKEIITQNIDMLHQRAGSENVHEVHGTLNTLTCVSCYKQYDIHAFLAPYIENGSIPKCPECNHVLKPDVILFGEQLPVHVWQEAEKAIRACDLMLITGSSLEVMPVAGLPMKALNSGADLIVINNYPTYIDVRAKVVLNSDVSEVLPLIVSEILHDKKSL